MYIYIYMYLFIMYTYICIYTIIYYIGNQISTKKKKIYI